MPTTFIKVLSEHGDIVWVIVIRAVDSAPRPVLMERVLSAIVSHRPPVAESIVLRKTDMGWGRGGRAVAASVPIKAEVDHLRSIT